MERRAFIAKSFVAFGEAKKVFGGLRYRLSIKADYDATKWLISMRDIKVDLDKNIQWLAMRVDWGFEAAPCW